MKTEKIICIVCPVGCELTIEDKSGELKVTGHRCPRGIDYAKQEMIAPVRVVTSTVKIVGWRHPVISVKTSKPIPKNRIFDIMHMLSRVEIKVPIQLGQVIVENILNLGVDVISTKQTD